MEIKGFVHDLNSLLALPSDLHDFALYFMSSSGCVKMDHDMLNACEKLFKNIDVLFGNVLLSFHMSHVTLCN